MKLEAGACCFVDFVVAGLFSHLILVCLCISPVVLEGISDFPKKPKPQKGVSIFFCILLSQMFDHRGG